MEMTKRLRRRFPGAEDPPSAYGPLFLRCGPEEMELMECALTEAGADLVDVEAVLRHLRTLKVWQVRLQVLLSTFCI
jgi:hypothetical protein